MLWSSQSRREAWKNSGPFSWDSSFCSEIFVICWIESVDPVADLCLTNQIWSYSVLLNAFEFKEITEVQNAHLKILIEDDETRTRGCKYWTSSSYLLTRLLRFQKRAARLLLDADFIQPSVSLFSKLKWLPIFDLIKQKKTCSFLHYP